MNRNAFYYQGFLYLLVGFLSASIFLATPILLSLYGLLFFSNVYLLVKHRSINPGILVIGSVFIILYTWFSWTDHSIFYQPDGLHSLLGLVLVVYGLLFAHKNEKRTNG